MEGGGGSNMEKTLIFTYYLQTTEIDNDKNDILQIKLYYLFLFYYITNFSIGKLINVTVKGYKISRAITQLGLISAQKPVIAAHSIIYDFGPKLRGPNRQRPFALRPGPPLIVYKINALFKLPVINLSILLIQCCYVSRMPTILTCFKLNLFEPDFQKQ